MTFINYHKNAIVTISQSENGMYVGHIRYKDGEISDCTASTSNEVHRWILEHDDIGEEEL